MARWRGINAIDGGAPWYDTYETADASMSPSAPSKAASMPN